MGCTWCAGKKSSTSLDHTSYYMIVGMEVQMHDQIMARRSLKFPPLVEESFGRAAGSEPSYAMLAIVEMSRMNRSVLGATVLWAKQPVLIDENYAN